MRQWINLVESQDVGKLIDQWRAPKGLAEPRPEDWKMFRIVREYAREYAGGGGLCHEVSEWIEHGYGWERRDGSYLYPNGEVCIAGHYWNLLPDGSILDCTADQTGENHDMVLIHPDDPAYGRYDDEWQEEWNPGEDDFEGNTNSPLRRGAYTGENDYEQQDRLEAERGKHWWATHPEQLKQYIRQQIDYAEKSGNEWSDKERFEEWLHQITQRHPDA